MTFVERAMNVAAFFGWHLFDLLVFGREMNALKIKYNIKPECFNYSRLRFGVRTASIAR